MALGKILTCIEVEIERVYKIQSCSYGVGAQCTEYNNILERKLLKRVIHEEEFDTYIYLYLYLHFMWRCELFCNTMYRFVTRYNVYTNLYTYAQRIGWHESHI